MTNIDIIFIALFVCALAALIAYRAGMGTGARAQRLNNQALQNAQAKALQSSTRTIECLNTRLAALLTRQTETAERAMALETKQETHQAQLEAIMQDADTRVAIYARRANPFSHADRITLQAAANQLDLAANTYSGLHAGDQVRFARQMQQRLLNLVERLDAALKANDRQAAAAHRAVQRSHLVHGQEGCGKTTNARAIADALGLKDILDNWHYGMPFPQQDTLVLTNETGEFAQFRDRVLTYQQAMQLVAEADNKAAA